MKNPKKIILSSGAVVLVAAGLFYWYTISFASVGNVNIYNGDAQITRNGKIIPAGTGTKVQPHDLIKVSPNSRISIILKDGSVIRLEAGTQVEVEDLSYQGKQIKHALFKITTGRMWSKPKALTAGASFQVETPKVVATVRGTSWDTDYLDQVNKVFVYQHVVSVNFSGSSDAKPVNQNQIFTIRDSNLQGDFNLGPVDATAANIDDWYIFNEGEDRKIDPSITTPPPADNSNGQVQGVTIENLITPEPPPTPAPVPAPKKPAKKLAVAPVPVPVPTPTPVPVPAPVITPVPVLPPLILNNGNGGASGSPTPPPPPPPPVVPVPVGLDISAIRTGFDPLTVQFHATEIYSDQSTQDVTDSAIWSVTNADPAGSIDDSGLYSANGAGTDTVQASIDSLSEKFDIDTNSAQNGFTIAFSSLPSNPRGPYQAQFTATASYDDGSTQDITRDVTWSTQSQTGFIDNSDFPGRYSTSEHGTNTVFADYQSFPQASKDITTPGLLAGLTLDYNSTQNPGEFQFIAIANYDDGTSFDVTNSTGWSVEPDGTAAGSIDPDSGLYQATNTGSDIIDATYTEGSTTVDSSESISYNP